MTVPYSIRDKYYLRQIDDAKQTRQIITKLINTNFSSETDAHLQTWRALQLTK